MISSRITAQRRIFLSHPSNRVFGNVRGQSLQAASQFDKSLSLVKGSSPVPHSGASQGQGISTKKALEAKKDLIWELKIEDTPKLSFDIFSDKFAISTFILNIYASKA
jgi:hypothetical protein